MVSSSSAPPRSIQGSVGSRIRVVLGETGSNWLLILNEDDGDREWQTHAWTDIPNAIAKQLNNCSNKGRYATEFDFGPTGAWYVNGIKRDGTGEHSWWGGTAGADEIRESDASSVKVSFGSRNYNYYGNEDESYVIVKGRNGYSHSNIDDDLSSRIKRINKRKKEIKFVRLFAGGGYFISDSEGTEWKSVGKFCSEDIESRNSTVNDVAVAKDGSWVVIGKNSYSCSTGVANELKTKIANFYSEQKKRNQRRQAQIREYHARVRREATERAERERAERERIERERAEQEERAVRERAEREEKERREREQADREKAFLIIEEEVKEESECIKGLELQVLKRKRALDTTLASLPPERRAKLSIGEVSVTVTMEKEKECVVCQDNPAKRAVVPCGHRCLCHECGDRVVGQRCPICRGNVQSVLTIYET